MNEYEKVRNELLRHGFHADFLDKATAARLAAMGIIAAENDEQIVSIVQAIGDAVEPTEQGVVLMSAYAIVAKESK